MNEIIEIELTPEKELFYNNDFGVYACSTEEKGLVKLNNWDNFVINGSMPKLVIGKTYQAVLTEVQHKKYGLSYEVKVVRQEMPTTIASQHAFIRSILSSSHAEAIISKFPNDDILSAIKNNTFDYKSVKGIKDKTYIKIKEKIVDNYEIQEALVELSQYGVTYTIIKKLVNHYGSSTMVIHKVKQDPYILCDEVSGLGFIKVDEYAQQMGIKPDSPYRLNAAIVYTLNQEESNGHCWLTIDNCIKNVVEITGLTNEEIRKHIHGDELPKSQIYLSENQIGLSKNYYYESKIKSKLLELLSVQGNFNIPDIDLRIKNVEEEQGFSFTDEQRKAIFESVKHNVIIISGKAGTGKSTILKGVIKTLQGYSYETCAFSGKASQRIVESTGLTSKTIHRLLEYKPPEGFFYRSGNELPMDILVLDEASMVNNHLFYCLVDAVKTGGKLIILGDVEQLPPIGAGCIFRDAIESGVIPVVELTQVHRQALKSGILLAANYIREGKQITEKYLDSNRIVGELKDLYIIPKQTDEELLEYIVNTCEKSKGNVDLMDFQVIVPMKTRGTLSTKNLNVALQKVFNPSNDDIYLQRNNFNFRVNDKIIKNGNDYENEVFNGTLGVITDIDLQEKTADIQFLGSDKTVTYTQEQLSQIDMAYALTVHRTQGSQFKNVIVGLDYSAYVLLSRQLAYTALTRASSKCILACNNDALRYAIGKNDSAKRNTFLKDLLMEA